MHANNARQQCTPQGTPQCMTSQHSTLCAPPASLAGERVGAGKVEFLLQLVTQPLQQAARRVQRAARDAAEQHERVRLALPGGTRRGGTGGGPGSCCACVHARACVRACGWWRSVQRRRGARLSLRQTCTPLTPAGAARAVSASVRGVQGRCSGSADARACVPATQRAAVQEVLLHAWPHPLHHQVPLDAVSENC